MYLNFFKRLLDSLLSLIGIIVLSPVILIVMILIKLDSKGPVLFVQERIGRNNVPFKIYKFRSMKIDAPETPTHLLEKPDMYITKVGKFLRKSSLDEIPQLYNILIGEMSIVGPRPALWSQHDLNELRDKVGVSKIRPGLTGWAQINGRDELSTEKKVEFDAYYCEHVTFGLDVKIFFKTFLSVGKSDGIVEGKVK